MIGGLVMGVLNMGLSILSVDAAWQMAIKGLVLLLACRLRPDQQATRRALTEAGARRDSLGTEFRNDERGERWWPSAPARPRMSDDPTCRRPSASSTAPGRCPARR